MLAAVGAAAWRSQMKWAVSDQTVFSREKLTWAADADVVVAGDSRAVQGIRPNLLVNHGVGTRAKNFAFSALSYSDLYLSDAEALFARDSSPSILICTVAPANFNAATLRDNSFLDAVDAKPQYGRILEYRLDLACESARLGSPPIRPLQVLYSLLGREPEARLTMTPSPDGWMAADQTPRSESVNLPLVVQTNFFEPPLEDRIDRFFARIKALGERGVDVYCVWPPASPALRGLEEGRTGWTEPMMRERAERAGATWLRSDLRSYTSYDGVHLTPDGAEDFTEDLATQIVGHRAAM